MLEGLMGAWRTGLENELEPGPVVGPCPGLVSPFTGSYTCLPHEEFLPPWS